MNTTDIVANVKINKSKLHDYLLSFEPAIEAGEVTYEEVRECVIKRLAEFADIQFEKPEELIEPDDPRVAYQVFKNGKEYGGTFEECRIWLDR
jgi:hypothetical protein